MFKKFIRIPDIFRIEKNRKKNSHIFRIFSGYSNHQKKFGRKIWSFFGSNDRHFPDISRYTRTFSVTISGHSFFIGQFRTSSTSFRPVLPVSDLFWQFWLVLAVLPVSENENFSEIVLPSFSFVSFRNYLVLTSNISDKPKVNFIYKVLWKSYYKRKFYITLLWFFSFLVN